MRKIVYGILILTILLSSFSYYSITKKRLYRELEKEYKAMGCRLYHERILEGAPKWVQAANYKIFGKNFAEFHACADLTQAQLEEVLEFTKLTEVYLDYTKGLDLQTLSNLKLKKLTFNFANLKNLEALKGFDLEYLQVAASNFKDFTLIQHMKNLKELVTNHIRPEDKAWMQKHLPQCKITISFQVRSNKSPN